MRCERSAEAGAYVLGALSPSERAAYQQHLATCAICRDEVADLAGLPGLLGRLDDETAADLVDPVSAPPSTVADVLTRISARRRRNRARIAFAGLAAACLVVIAGFTGAALRPQPAATPVTLAVALQPMSSVTANNPITAQIALVPEGTGTRLQMHCTYEAGDKWHDTWKLKLYVYAKGQTDRGNAVAMWSAESGSDLSVTGHSALPVNQIGKVELRRGDDTLLLSYVPA